jgi:hypothetical protein
MSQQKPIVVALLSVLLVLAPLCMPAWVGQVIPRSGAEDDAGGVDSIRSQDGIEELHLKSEPILASSLARIPLYFVENRGQVDERVGYYVQGRDKTLYFTSQGLTFVLSGPAPTVMLSAAKHLDPSGGEEIPFGLPQGRPRSARNDTSGTAERWVVKLEFIGAAPDVQPVGEDETSGVVSYFKGRPDEWVTGLKTYSRVVYRDLWPGIDLEYTGTVNELKYQFAVGPGADPSQIQLAYRGADIAINEAGQLEVSTPVGGFEDGAPYAYQPDEGGAEVEVGVSYELGETLGVSETARVYGFRIGTYDPSRVLVLDPVVLFHCGYIGGVYWDSGYGIAVDSEGNAYITGATDSPAGTFPDTVGPDLTHNGTTDAFVAKVQAGRANLVYCGYIGGLREEQGKDVAVDSEGRAHVTGWTWSSPDNGFPVTVGPHLVHSGSLDAFVARVSADGTSLEYCGYIGGDGSDDGQGIALDGSGCAYVSGTTSSDQGSFPVTIGPDLRYNGGSEDAFVAKVRSDGMGLDYCGYIGGDWSDGSWGIAVSSTGRAYVVGQTGSSEADGFPVKVGPDLTYNGGTYDAFVAKVKADGTGLVYCGYVGGSQRDEGHDVALDSAGCAYMTGETSSSPVEGFPVSVGPELTYSGSGDVFVAKVASDGLALAYCGYIGGSRIEDAGGIAVDGDGCAYVCGDTWSSELQGFPVTVGPDLSHNGGDDDVFVAKVRVDGSWFDYCGYIGGTSKDLGSDVALEQVGEDYAAHVLGRTESSETEGFPVIQGPDLSHNGDWDAFVARVGPNHAPTLGTITPSSGASVAFQRFVIITTWQDIDGLRDLKHLYSHIGDSPSLVGNVTLLYNRPKHRLWIRSDDGSAWQGGCMPGTATYIGNSQAVVSCENTTVASAGPDTLTVTWYMWSLPGFTGTKKTGLKCKDMHKAKAKGKWMGTWTFVG